MASRWMIPPTNAPPGSSSAKLSAEHKLGVGFTRKAYTNTVMDKYGGWCAIAHSGLVEYTLGMGWPGIALWAAFC